MDWYKALWTLFALVWVIGAITSKRTVRRQSEGSRIIQAGLLLLGFLLLFQPWRLGQLNIRVVPDTRTSTFFGLALTAIGLAIAIWARLVLGRNWSGTVTVKEDHRLIRTGPYRMVRHPIYSGVLLAMIGTAFGYGRAPGLIGIAIVLLALWMKSRTEEGFMIEQFGEQYVEYKNQVKAIIPGVL